MKTVLLAIAIHFTFSSLQAQTPSTYNKSAFVSTGPSWSGSGDVNGFFLKIGVQKKVKRWNFSISQSTTIHDGTYPMFFEISPGIINDGSIKYSVTGVELTPAVGYSIISNRTHDLHFGIGAVLGYQSSGDNDSYALLYPALTGLPYPVLYFQNYTPIRTFAVGPLAQVGYDFSLKPKLFLGGYGSFQFDSNGDNLANYGIRVGYRFK